MISRITEAHKASLIIELMHKIGCTQQVAKDELESEEWDIYSVLYRY